MRTYLLMLAFICTAALSLAQTSDDYNSTLARFKVSYNANQADSIHNMFNDRIKQLIPPDKAKEMVVQMTSKLGAMQSYEFIKTNNTVYYYKVIFTNTALTLLVSLSKDNKFENFRFAPLDTDTSQKDKSNFVCKSDIGNIYGTLSMPVSTSKVPVVLIIAGSGPTDRNGNQVGLSTNAYKMIADSLRLKGIACLRYDKRGIGESMAAARDEEHTKFSDMVDDAAGILHMLKADARFSKVYILGHSEGSLIGMIAAEKEKVNGYISLAGAGERADKILERQLGTVSPSLAARAKVVLDSLLMGATVTKIDSDLYTYFHPSVQPYLSSWLKFDPEKEISTLKLPILILQGTTDKQVSVKDAALLAKAAPKAQLKYITGMNHVLKQAPEEMQANMATYNQPELPLSIGLMPPIYKFITTTK